MFVILIPFIDDKQKIHFKPDNHLKVGFLVFLGLNFFSVLALKIKWDLS